MKKLAILFLAGTVSVMAASAAEIVITPPTITLATTTNGTELTGTELDALNLQVGNAFKNIENTLNDKFFNQMANFPDLNKGFANANMATFDNASLGGYQNYDLFAVALGGNLGFAVPTVDPAAAQSTLEEIVKKGDAYVGLATGGVAAQGGLNLGFLFPNLYGSARLGFTPEAKFGDNSFSQGSFGLGANYSVIKGFDLLLGLVKWRGINVGSGIVMTGNKVQVSLPVDGQSQSVTQGVGGYSVTINAKTANTKANLTVETFSTVIPIDVMTSLQAFWLLNVGLGAGVDLAYSSGQVKLGAGSDVQVTSPTKYEATEGNVTLKTNQAAATGDFIVPRLSGSVGLSLLMVRLDFPVNYFPTTKAFSFGVTGAVVF